MRSTTSHTTAETMCVHHCFKWIYLILLSTGCLCLHVHDKTIQPASTVHRLCEYIMRVTLVGGFLGGVAHKLRNEEQTRRAMFDSISPVMKFILVFECGCCVATYLEMAFKFEAVRHAHLLVAQGIQQLDERMVRDFPGLRWHYHKTMRKFTYLTCTVVTLYFSMALLYIFNMSNCSCHLLTTSLVAITYACITTATGIVGALHIGQMDLLRLRYRLIERMVRQQLLRRDLRSHEDVVHARIYRLVEYCKSYTELILQVNSVFGFVCIVGLFYDFGILTNMAFLLCQKASASTATPPEQYVFIAFFMLPRIYKVMMTATYGYMVGKEKRKCLHTISTFINYFRPTPQLQEAHQLFLFWKMHHNFQLTMGQITPCSLNMAYMVLHGVINYVIILIQLQFQQNNISNLLNFHDMAKDVELFNPAKP